MADINAYKAHQNMMKNPERRKAYIEAMKRRKKDTASRNKISKPSRSMMVDTTTSAYGDAGRGRPVPKFGKDIILPPRLKKPEPRKNQKRLPPKEDNYGQFSNGGEAKVRGMGAAITGGKFEGVF